MIDLGLRTSHLYCAFKLRVQIECPGDDREIEATGFVVKTSDSALVLVTNRHVLGDGLQPPLGSSAPSPAIRAVPVYRCGMSPADSHAGQDGL
jgi:hypothetical protein